MSLKNFFTLRTFGVMILLIFLLLGCKVLWELHRTENDTANQIEKYGMFLNKYNIQRNAIWKRAFQKGKSLNQKSAQFQQNGDSLIIQKSFIASIGHRGEYYQQKTIEIVTQISPQSLNKFFVVKSSLNQQVFYRSQESLNKNSDPQNKNYKRLEKCLELEVQLNDKEMYFVDELNRFWLISHPHNKLLFIQIYDCQNHRLIKKIFHEPMHNKKSYLINELVEVKISKQHHYQIKLLTYESHEYIVEVSASQTEYQIQSIKLQPSHTIRRQKILLKGKSLHSSAQSAGPTFKYTFLDPLNKIFTQQFEYLIFSMVKDFMSQIKFLLNAFGVSTKTLNAYISAKIRMYNQQKDPEYFDYDLQSIDEENGCVVNLEYHLNELNEESSQNQSQNAASSSLTRLSKYIINSRTPVFHSIDNYDKFDSIEVLKKQKVPPISEFKRIHHDQGYDKQYATDYFYSVYKTEPDSQIHFLGVGQKIFYLHPNEKVKDQYLHVRSKTGGLIMQGSKIKGAYEDRPLQSAQVQQKYYIQANQVNPGVFQAHAGYRALYSSLKGNKVELVNGLTGKAMANFIINFKQGYRYSGSYLFNNQWWVVQFNINTQRSELTKHEMYVESAYPKQLIVLKRTYGKLIDSELSDEEDDLLQVFQEYNDLYRNKGLVILDIFRCLDEFYYFQVCDAQGKNYAIIRIHFKRLSNRLPKTSGKYSGEIEKSLIIEASTMVKQTQKMDPFMLVLEETNLFDGIQILIKENKIHEWRNYIIKSDKKSTTFTELQKINQFSFLPYAVFSHQQNDQTESLTSKQQIYLVNMRVLVENAKKKFMIETKTLAKSRLRYFVIFVVIILLSLIVKITLSKDLKKIEEEKAKLESKQKGQNNGKTKSSPEKNKKDKTK